MKQKFRVKEVRVPFELGGVNYYYPQKLDFQTIVKGHLWWKKKEKSEIWKFMYESTDGYIFIDANPPHNSTKIVCCQSIEEAKLFIEKYKIFDFNIVKKKYSENVNDWTDERFIKFYDIE